MAEPGTIGAPRWRDALIAVVLAAAVLVVYRYAFTVYFLNEDFTWLRQCRFRPGRGLWQLVTQDVMGGTYSWRPLMQVSIAASYALHGLDPFGYRLDSLVCHVVAVWLLYAIGLMVADRQRAVTAAVVFGLHPLQVESVSWTCARGGPMSTVFVLLAVVGFLRWRGRGGSLWWVAAPFAFGLMTQENAVVLLGIVMVADLLFDWPEVTVRRRLGLYGTLVAVVAGVLLVRRTMSPAALVLNMIGFDPRWPFSLVGTGAFLWAKVCAAAALLLTLQAGAVGVPAAALLAASAASLWLWRRGAPGALWGLLWIGIALAPYSLLILGPTPRHMHLPLAGFGLLSAELVAALTDRLRRGAPRLASACVAVGGLLWLGFVVPQIDREIGHYLERGRLTQIFLNDLQRTLPTPQPGSTLAFYQVGDLRVRDGVFIYGLEDAVRLLYADDSLQVRFLALGDATDVRYHLIYEDGHLHRVADIRPQ